MHVTEYNRDHMTVAWEVPETDGGSPITGYVIERRDARRDSYISGATADADTLQTVVKKLVEGNQYYFRVFAQNKIGVSQPTETTEAVSAKLPFDPPGPPSKFQVSNVTKSTATLSWEAPEFDGGSPVTGYYIEKLSGSRWTKASKKSTMKMTLSLEDLFEGDRYEYRVFATNEAGDGKPCEPVSFVAKNPYDVPSQPGQPEVTEITAETAVLAWTPPESDGGDAISNYIVEMRRAGDMKWITVKKDVVDTTFTVTGLTQETEYEFRVTAENKAGLSSPSAPSSPAKYG